MSSQVRQNFHPECESAVNQLINLELHASFMYLSMSSHFDRDDVALSHTARFFRKQSNEEKEHAERFLAFQNQRGGRVVLKDIRKPEEDEWDNSLEALQKALQLEKTVNQALLDLHKLATEKEDPHQCDFLETNYLEEQVKAIKRLGDHVTNLKHVGVPENSTGEYLFDLGTCGQSVLCSPCKGHTVYARYSTYWESTEMEEITEYDRLSFVKANRRSNYGGGGGGGGGSLSEDKEVWRTNEH